MVPGDEPVLSHWTRNFRLLRAYYGTLMPLDRELKFYQNLSVLKDIFKVVRFERFLSASKRLFRTTIEARLQHGLCEVRHGHVAHHPEGGCVCSRSRSWTLNKQMVPVAGHLK